MRTDHTLIKGHSAVSHSEWRKIMWELDFHDNVLCTFKNHKIQHELFQW